MAQYITPFDPSAQPQGNIPVTYQNGSWALIFNESPVELLLRPGGVPSPTLVAAYTVRSIPLTVGSNTILWQQGGIVLGSSQAPISQVYGEVYDPDEWKGGYQFLSLSRQVNLGNSLVTTAATSIVNDGNVAGTQIVEATVSGHSPSDIIITNSGDVTTKGNVTAASIQFSPAVSSSFAHQIYDNGNHQTTYWSPTAGGTAQGHIFVTWSGAAIKQPFAIGSTGSTGQTVISDAGALTNVAGQATAGNFGVPVVVAQTLRQSITNNVATTVLSFSIPANGMYRLSGSAYVNSNANTKVVFKYSYTTPAGINPGYFFFTLAGGNLLDGASTTIFTPPATDLQILPRTIHANAGTLDVVYQDPTGTVSDLVSVVLERLG